jgi:hypothetical protein
LKTQGFIKNTGTLAFIGLVWSLNLGEIIGHIGQLDFIDDIELEWLLELEGIPRDIGQLDFIGNIELE